MNGVRKFCLVSVTMCVVYCVCKEVMRYMYMYVCCITCIRKYSPCSLLIEMYLIMCVILHLSVITQDGNSALMGVATGGKTEIFLELLKAGANLNLQDRVCQYKFIIP